MTIPDDSPKGYILQIHLGYHKQFYVFQKKIPCNDEYHTPLNRKSSKQYMINLNIYYRNLKQGLKLTKIQTVI